MKKIALGSWAFVFGPYAGDPLPFDKTAKRMAEAGYDGIELCGAEPHVTLDRYSSKESRAKLKAMLTDLGLGIAGYGADQTAFDPTEAASKEKYVERFARHVELCNDLGVKDIRIDTGAPPERYRKTADHESAKGRVVEVFNAVAEKAEEAGIRLSWEFEPGFIFNKPSEILELCDKVAHTNFGVMYDTSHAYMCAVVGARQFGKKETLPGGAEELLDKLEGKIFAIHLIDSDGTLHNDDTSTHSPLGTGHIDFKALTPKLLSVPNIEYWTIDMCFWPGAWELIDASLAYVKNLLKSAETSAASG